MDDNPALVIALNVCGGMASRQACFSVPAKSVGAAIPEVSGIADLFTRRDLFSFSDIAGENSNMNDDACRLPFLNLGIT